MVKNLFSLCFLTFMCLGVAGDPPKKVHLFPFEEEGVPNGKELYGKGSTGATLHFFEQQDLVRRLRPVLIPRDLIGGIETFDVLVLNLFPDKSLTATVSRVDQHENGSQVVTAIPDGGSGYFVLSVNGPRGLGVLYLPEEDRFYQIISDPLTHEHCLVEMVASELHAWTRLVGETSAGWDNAPEVSKVGLTASPQIEHDRISKAMEQKGIGPDDPATIRVMIVYTEDAMVWADEHGGGVENIISLAMAKAQLTLDNSQVGIELGLAHSARVDYTESGNSHVDLYRFASAPGHPPLLENVMGHPVSGFMDEIHSWRDEHRADLCALFSLTGTGAVGFLMNTSNGQPDYAFSRSPIRVVAQDLTHIHELGHNMGCHHNPDHSTQPGPTMWTNWPGNTWSAAWRWFGTDDEQYGSVMSGPTESEEFCWTMPYFSNPLVSHLGAPTGHPGLADNARTLREMKHVIAAYRSTPFSLESDSLALVALYHATGGPQWINNDNWLTGPLHTWHGLKFGVFLREINLSENNLAGTIPPEIGELATLEKLYLDRNQLSGQIPSGLGHLHGLIDLNLSFNALDGSLPDEMAGLEALGVLDLSMNKLSGSIPEWIGNLTNLRWLNVSQNRFTGTIPADLDRLSGLEGLLLSDNLLSGSVPGELGLLKELRSLNLSSNPLSGPVPESFGELGQLLYLYLYDCGLEGVIPVGLCHLPELLGINIDLNYFSPESCPTFSCLRAKNILLGTGTQRSGLHLGTECPEMFLLSLEVDPPGAAAIDGYGVYPPGEEVVIGADPNPGYTFSHWQGDTIFLSSASDPAPSLVMPGQHVNLTAVFDMVTLTITATAGPHGHIEPGGAVVVPYGQDKAFSIVPDEGYVISIIKVNGNPIDTITDIAWNSAASEYTFKAVVNDHYLEADFVTDHTGLGDAVTQTLRVYPNPAHGYFVVGFENPGGGTARVKLYNLQGQLVKRRDVNGAGWNEAPFSTGRLPTGIYIIRVEGGPVFEACKVIVE